MCNEIGTYVVLLRITHSSFILCIDTVYLLLISVNYMYVVRLFNIDANDDIK